MQNQIKKIYMTSTHQEVAQNQETKAQTWAATALKNGSG